jgi:predicted DNA binding CopG/RHH family protein
MKFTLKKLPKFQSEDEEREFWATHDTVDYFDWEKAVVNAPMPNLKPTSELISLRLPLELLDKLKTDANRQGLPYQTYLKSILHKALFNHP